MKTAQDHLLQAGKERVYYNGQVDVAQASALASKSGGTTPRLAHYSFDFSHIIRLIHNKLAQNILKPVENVLYLGCATMESLLKSTT